MVNLGGRSQLEICVDSVESAREAAAGGADRLELCGSLIIGGTSPDPNLLKAVRRVTDIPVFCMVRPRFGDFLYTEDEYQICLDDVRMYRKLGADGIVIGILKPDGTLDADRIRGLMEEAGGMGVTLHRCFDLVKDPAAALEKAVDLGIDIILTSGGHQTAPEGTGLLGKLQEQAAGRILIQAGSGVNAGNIPGLYRETGIRSFHMSGKRIFESGMRYRKKGVSMGLPSISEYLIDRTDRDKVCLARKTLDALDTGVTDV